jgi:anti-sigma factor RsiW
MTHHETGDVVAALTEGCRVAVAEELRRLADERKDEFDREREVCGVHIRECPRCARDEQAMREFVVTLRARADELDPEGAR